MHSHTYHVSDWQSPLPANQSAQAVLVFGPVELLEHPHAWPSLSTAYPAAVIVGCSSGGDIDGARVCDSGLQVTELCFANARVRGRTAMPAPGGDAFRCGRLLGLDLLASGLVHVLLLVDGLQINAEQLVAGLRGVLGRHVGISGGLAADGTRFERTAILGNAPASRGCAVAVGFYGGGLHVACGAAGGWNAFGPDRVITRSDRHVLYELDGRPALDLFRQYLGQAARQLPGAGLFLPLRLQAGEDEPDVVRAVVGLAAEDGGLVFAGSMPEGSRVQLMHADCRRLVSGAEGAAIQCRDGLAGHDAEFALLVSGVGRKAVLSQRVDDEVESVRRVLGDQVATCGFYGYGEIAPLPGGGSRLNSQTMSVTVFRETH